MTEAQARALAIARDALARNEAELAGDADADPVEELRQRCNDLGIQIIDETIDGGGRLRSPWTIRNRRQIYGKGIPAVRLLGRVRYRLEDVGAYPEFTIVTLRAHLRHLSAALRRSAGVVAPIAGGSSPAPMLERSLTL